MTEIITLQFGQNKIQLEMTDKSIDFLILFLQEMKSKRIKPIRIKNDRT